MAFHFIQIFYYKTTVTILSMIYLYSILLLIYLTKFLHSTLLFNFHYAFFEDSEICLDWYNRKKNDVEFKIWEQLDIFEFAFSISLSFMIMIFSFESFKHFVDIWQIYSALLYDLMKPIIISLKFIVQIKSSFIDDLSSSIFYS